MLTTHDILWGIVYPLIAAVVAMLLAHLKRRGRRDTHEWGVPLALAVGFTIAFVGVAGRVQFPPTTGQQWLVFAAATAVVISIIASISERTRIAVILSSIALLVLVMAWLVPANRRQWLTTREAALTMTFIGGGLTLWWALMEPLATRYRAFMLPLVLSGVAGGAALVIADNGWRDFGVIEGGIAVMLLAVALLALWLRNLSLASGGILTITFVVLGLLVSAYLYADVKWPQIVILAIAPLFAWVEMLPVIRSRKPWQRFAIVAVLVLAVIAIAAVPAAQGLRKTMQEQSESYMY